MSTKQTLKTANEHMDKAVEHTLHEFAGLRTGKASPSMVEGIHVKVEAYGGSQMAVRELAAVTTPDSHSIQIQPWDKSTANDIKKGIQQANVGLNPVADGQVLRITVPELSKERRQELVKIAHGLAEEGKVSVRHARREALDALKKAQKAGDISEDDLHRHEKEVQEMTDKHVARIDEALATKEKDLLTV